MQGNVAEVSQEFFADDGVFPNSTLPLIVYRGAVIEEEVTPEAMETMFERNGWPPRWRSGIFDYHHYHSTAHEVLGIASGSAEVMFGGPEGRVLKVSAGDVVVIPAGVAHRRISASADFLVVGGYPPGTDWDLLRGEEGERPEADETIAAVALPRTDPVGGQRGPLLRAWVG